MFDKHVPVCINRPYGVKFRCSQASSDALAWRSNSHLDHRESHRGTHSVVSSTSDQVIRGFFGFSANNCTAQVPSTTAPAFAAALQTFRTAVQTPGPAFGTFYIDSTKHTWLSSEYTRSEDGVQMRAFVGNVLSGGPAQHLGPD